MEETQSLGAIGHPLDEVQAKKQGTLAQHKKGNLDVSLLCFTIKDKCLSAVMNAFLCLNPPILAHCVSVGTLIKYIKVTDTSIEHNH